PVFVLLTVRNLDGEISPRRGGDGGHETIPLQSETVTTWTTRQHPRGLLPSPFTHSSPTQPPATCARVSHHFSGYLSSVDGHDVGALSIALGCEVQSPQQASRAPTSQELEGLALESWEEFQERCCFPETESITSDELEEVRAALRDNSNLARTTVVRKLKNGSSRECLLLIRSCARLGRAEVVLALLAHNLDSDCKTLCKQLLLYALPGHISYTPTGDMDDIRYYVWLRVLGLFWVGWFNV
ncbi:unnamed protein product, partial [Ectocarpus sp. 13 AM-2016]